MNNKKHPNTASPVSLFHETYSELFLSLCHVINQLHQGTRLTRQDILDQLPHVDWGNQQKLDELLDAVFLFAPDDEAHLFLDKPIHYQPSIHELRWLKTMLLDRRADFLLPGDLRQELLRRLAAVDILPLDTIWEQIHAVGDDLSNAQMKQKLSTLWQALRDRQQLYYINHDRQGILHEGLCSPCRLEYDASAHHCCLIIWNEYEQRAIKLNLASIQQLHLSEQPIPGHVEPAFQAFLQNKQQQVTVRLTPHNNAVLRCFSLFAAYDKQSSYDEDTDTYLLTIFFYQFDYTEILHQILSLGAAATVIEPAAFRQDILCRLQAAASHYPEAFCQKGGSGQS